MAYFVAIYVLRFVKNTHIVAVAVWRRLAAAVPGRRVGAAVESARQGPQVAGAGLQNHLLRRRHIIHRLFQNTQESMSGHYLCIEVNDAC